MPERERRPGGGSAVPGLVPASVAVGAARAGRTVSTRRTATGTGEGRGRSQPAAARSVGDESRLERPTRRGGPGRSRGETPADVPGDPEQSLGDPESAARIICLRLLDRRARSRAELADALRRRGIPDDAAETVLNRFAEVGLVDDPALAQTVAAAHHTERGLARRAVAQKLRRRGFADEDVAAAVDTIDGDDERARAHDLVRRKLRTLSTVAPEVQLRRLVGLLGRKGYPPGLAYQVVRQELAAAADSGVAVEVGYDEAMDAFDA